MYRLLLVDDEEIEREGMEQFIPWEQYGIELIGAAWNGIEALEIIREKKPDIVLTDMKMPVMDGIALIREAKKISEDIVFIVLSGYGEYEYTSQAMEEGIRHYVLKPCDEEKIIYVMERVKEEIRAKRSHFAKEKGYQKTVRSLLPRAREQVFRNLLLGREEMRDNYQMFLEEMGDAGKLVVVLAVRGRRDMDALEQFILENILGECLGEGINLMSTCIRNEVFFLLRPLCTDRVRDAFFRAREEFLKLKDMSFIAALSNESEISGIHQLYRQVEELFLIGGWEDQQEFLYCSMFQESGGDAALLVNYRCLAQTEDFAEIIFECYLACLKMTLKGYSLSRMREVFLWTEKILYGGECERKILKNGQEEVSLSTVNDAAWLLVEKTATDIAWHKGVAGGKEGQRMKKILLAVYKNLGNPEISRQYLAKNVLFINEDHFGRIFMKYQKKKFSLFLLEQRIELARQLIRYNPESKISDIAGLVGYPADGKYFSKMFKKVAGMSPSEYKDSLHKN